MMYSKHGKDYVWALYVCSVHYIIANISNIESDVEKVDQLALSR